MAFEVEQERNSVAWMPILIGLFIVLFTGGAVYYLFFSGDPLIASLVDQSVLEVSTNELSRAKEQLGEGGVLEDPIFKSLRQQVTPMVKSEGGRPNPFQPF